MSLLSNVNDTLSAILKVIFIIIILVFVFFTGLSLYANIAEGNQGKLPGMPGIGKAQYEVHIKTTNQILLTDEYDTPAPNRYILHGFYEVKDGRWEWSETDLPLDEYYFGQITINRRVK